MAKYDSTYVSEFDRFMKDYLEHHPEIVADQYRGRGIWWDKPADFGMIEDAATDSVPVDGYNYFGTPGAGS